jgi:hypothetical protein
MKGERTSGNQGPIPGTEHLSETAQAMMSQIALGNISSDTGTAPAEEAGSDSTSTAVDSQDAEEYSEEPEDSDTVSEGDVAEEEVPEDLAEIQQQYGAEVARLMEQYQRAIQERDQAKADYQHAVSFGTRKSQEAAEAQRLIEALNQRIAALEQRIATSAVQASAEQGTSPEVEALSELGLTPQALRSLLAQTPEYQQLVGVVQQMLAREQQREYESQVSAKTQALINKVESWSQELYGVPTSQLTDSNARQVLTTALHLYGTGQVEEAERLIRAEFGRQVAVRVAMRQQKANSAGLRAVSESARGNSPKGGKPRSSIPEVDFGEDFARLSAPEASARRQEVMLRMIDALGKKRAS